MKKFFLGVFVGIVLASVGFSGVFRMMDKSIDKVKMQSYELAR